MTKRKTHEQFVEEIRGIFPGYKVTGTYVNSRTDIGFECDNGHKSIALANNLSRGQGCSYCYGNNRKTHDEFVAKMKLVQPYMHVLGKYSNNYTSVEILCLKCSHEWPARPGNLLNTKQGCPRCAIISKGERQIEQSLTNLDVIFETQKTFNGCCSNRNRKLKFDFYLPEYNMVIEYNGEQHYRPIGFGNKNEDMIQKEFETILDNDSIKEEYCIDNNIKYLMIPYYLKDRIEDILNVVLTKGTV